ncbi:unnamed protein product [Bursaphelenchus okinawaensis]|uniref:Uncharacterized protein n=1 Tax=Bursaphelenchus okinawaensis TaxID=465554 RepID=A0A811JR78_9BILA|nr:unnamed protein product [Bursaphelenchus okinawaensis]CAG9079161.1 unnamed protein product [Bursaphelenchus okinawaensis]
MEDSELLMRDTVCTETYGECHKYCQVGLFCKIYCSPMCCVSSAVFQLQCKFFNSETSYAHNSSTFNLKPEYFSEYTGSAFGVYATEDVTFIFKVPLLVQNYRLALVVLMNVDYLVFRDEPIPL